MAIVSQLCIFFPYVMHWLCEDYLTCDIAFNAVMPLSRASTRGRYSRIEGVTASPVAPRVGHHVQRFGRLCVDFEELHKRKGSPSSGTFGPLKRRKYITVDE